MKEFKVGKFYEMRSACDHNCVWRFKVVGRSACTVTLQPVDANKQNRGTVIRSRINKVISERRGAESVMPLGRYSMAPVLSADNINQ